MASIKNSQNNPYVLKSIDSIKFMQANYFDTGCNNARSYAQKMEIINLICFLTQKLNKKDAEKYPDCLSVLGAILDVDLKDPDLDQYVFGFNPIIVRSFGLICDNLLFGCEDEIPKPENVTNAKEIKEKIKKYFTEEWAPF